MNPIDLFREKLSEALVLSASLIPKACCLSTKGLDGFPNARFVELKEILEGKFMITGTLSSLKGVEIRADDRVALTFWWQETGTQVRIQGRTTFLESAAADKYFRGRNIDSQIVSSISRQGKELKDEPALIDAYRIRVAETKAVITRPEDWGGFCIDPLRIEFLEFHPARLHRRRLFSKEKNDWRMIYLQP